MGYMWSRDKELVRGTLDQEEGRRGVRNTHREVNIKRKTKRNQNIFQRKEGIKCHVFV